MKLAHPIRPRGDDYQHGEVEKAECDLETHVGFSLSLVNQLPVLKHNNQPSTVTDKKLSYC